LFGVLTGLFARLLVEPELKKEDAQIEKFAEEIRLLREKVELLQEGNCKQPVDPRSIPD
jgi:hypothetical protein